MTEIYRWHGSLWRFDPDKAPADAVPFAPSAEIGGEKKSPEKPNKARKAAKDK